MRGMVDSSGSPVVRLEVAGREWNAVVDTGFNGELELPAALQPLVNARMPVKAPARLAGGRELEEVVYVVDFPFDGRVVCVSATFSSGETILLGTRLLQKYRPVIDFPGRTVELDRAGD